VTATADVTATIDGTAGDGMEPRARLAELCRHLYGLGWVSGTGGGMSLRQHERVFVAPSGVQKERIRPEDVFVLDAGTGAVLERPEDPRLRPSACTPLFFNAYSKRAAGAVLHSHSLNAMLVTLLCDDTFRCTHFEMMKGIRGVGYRDELVVPIIENTAHESELTDRMARAMDAHPEAQAVLVRRHGVYVWGADWAEAKTQAECFDYLFEAAVRMHALGLDPAVRPVSRPKRVSA
jgi:methylthioribulose-1-phosphate dehydratase